MSINISGQHMEVGESLTRHINDKIQNIIDKYMGGHILEANVFFHKDHHLFKAEVSIHISKNFVVTTHGDDKDAYLCVDHALSRLEKRVQKYKKRFHDKKTKGRNNFNDLSTSMPAYVIDAGAEDKGDEMPIIIAEQEASIDTLSVSEAVMRMDLSDAPVIFFRNAVNGELNAVYKRSDENIGWLDPSQKKTAH